MMLGLTASLLAWQTASDSGMARLNVSAFVDLYYAHDFARPSPRDRAFTTQAVRHGEVNVNLASVTLDLTRGRARGRVTLQAGTSVQANYAGEPVDGSISGPLLSRHIQEAYAGFRLGRGIWLDAGISLGTLGWEGWLSRDNPTYTRSLVAEFTPYYESGVRVIWDVRPGVTIQAHLMNGWQKISEDNDAKSASARVDVRVSPALTVAAAGFLGNEQPGDAARATRYFGQFMVKATPHPSLLLQAQVDAGRQSGPGGLKRWWGGVGIARLVVRPGLALVGRVERFSDPDQVVGNTGTLEGLEANGGSIGIDVMESNDLLWRTEVRTLRASGRIFPDDSGPAAARVNTVLVTSLALTLR